MSSSGRVVSRVQALFDSGALGDLSDHQLLDRFARIGEQAAFEVLVARHGPMVLGVCRRALGDSADVDDAFQAVFLVLVRRAGALGPNDVVAAWLHGVASRVARRARSDRARRERRERTGPAPEPASTQVPSPDFALREVIDEEVGRLPWKYRAPVALCYLEGLTHEEAARRLEWPVGSVKGRLARARALLGSRLGRRGVTAGVGALAGPIALERLGRAAVPEALRSSTVRTAVRIAEGCSWRIVVSQQVVHLARGVLASMLYTKLKAAATLAAAIGLVAAGARVAARQPTENPEPEAPIAATAPEVRKPATTPESIRPEPPPTDSPEDRFLDAARRAFLTASEDHARTQGSLDRVYRASRMLLDAQSQRAETGEDRKAAYAEHLDRMRSVSRVGLSREASVSTNAVVAESRVMLAEAELLLARLEDEPRTSGASTSSGDASPGSDRGEGTDARSAAVLRKLDAPLAMNFPNETPLEDVFRYIQQATQGPGEAGLPIYVDPIGLNEVDRTMTSPVSLDLDGIPLRRTLQLLLKQLGLVYFVEDGMVVVTSAEWGEQGLGPEMARTPPLAAEVEKATRGELTPKEMEALSEKLKAINAIREQYRELKTPRPPESGRETDGRSKNSE